MYHFRFNLPNADQNAATLFLPSKHHSNVPAIVSCYGSDKSHWPVRLEEGLHKLLVDKRETGFLIMQLAGDSDDLSAAACKRRTANLSEMMAWLRVRRYYNANKIGLFAFGSAAASALRFAEEINVASFVIATVTDETARAYAAMGIVNEAPDEPGMDILDAFIAERLKNAQIPVLILRGTTGQVTIQSGTSKSEDVVIQKEAATNSTYILFKGADYYMYNIVKQATGEIDKWMKSIGVIEGSGK